MRHKLGNATNQQEINIWRKAAKMCGMPIQIEIWEKLKPYSMYATISIYDPDFSIIWQQYQKTLIKRYGHFIQTSKLIYHKVEDIQKKFQQLFDKTAKGKKIIVEKKKAKKKEAKKDMEIWLAKPENKAIFVKAMEKNLAAPFLSTLSRYPFREQQVFKQHRR